LRVFLRGRQWERWRGIGWQWGVRGDWRERCLRRLRLRRCVREVARL
jgi:hypothetical protein